MTYLHTKYSKDLAKYQADIQISFLDLQYVEILKYIFRRPAPPNIFKSTHFAYAVLYLGTTDPLKGETPRGQICWKEQNPGAQSWSCPGTADRSEEEAQLL